jgi:predicted branched-subunit amino acid permease
MRRRLVDRARNAWKSHIAPAGSFRDGFVAMLPLWTGAIPSGVAFGAAARADGMSAGDAQLMSLIVFSAAAQMATLAYEGAGQSAFLVILTALAINAHLPLLDVAVARSTAPAWRTRLPLALLLTDGSFAVAAARDRLTMSVLAGAGASMYLAWNVGTAGGLLAGEALPARWKSPMELIVPLTFVAVLVPMLRSRRALAVTLAAGVTALVASRSLPAGVAVLIAGVTGAVVGAWEVRDV